MLGGRTNHWGRISLRFGPDDFRRKSLDGLGDDWPITYDDIKPYYDRVDRFVGIFGSIEGIHNEPDGVFMPPPEPRCWEKLIKKSADRLNVKCIPSRMSVITQSINGRPACHYCGQCFRGCATFSNFSSPSVLIPPAMKTGRLTIRTDAMAREVTLDANGLASGVTYIDKRTGRENHVQGRVVVLAASACESARILLNSKSSKFPQGLANSSGVVGKYLTDSTGAGVSGFIPKLMDGVAAQRGRHRRRASLHAVVARQQETRFSARLSHRDQRRPRHADVRLRRQHRQRFSGLHEEREIGGYGRTLKNDYRRFYGATVGFAGRGEMVPNENSYCEIDPNQVDRWGIPVLRFHWKWSDYEINQAKHMQDTFRAIITEMGGTPFGTMPGRDRAYGLADGGRIIHELGVTRMGSDPKSSVLNSNCQAHDVKNLFVADGGPFVSQADKNPTWTILALSWRTSDYIVEERKKGTL